MPIQFRCHNCRQVLSITSKKAGMPVTCPNCREETRVPTMDEVQAAISAAKRKKAAAKEDSSVGRDAARAAPAESEHATAPASVAAAPEEGAELWEHADDIRNPWLDEEADEEEPKIHKIQFNEGGLDMTPMVDVTFLLLIFFMITASFNIQKSMPTDPPEPEDEGAAQTMTVEEQEQEDLLVGISANDELTLDDEPISGIGALADALQAKSSGKTDLSMTIEADPRCTFGIMVGVMDAGISAGMQKIKRVARPVDE